MTNSVSLAVVGLGRCDGSWMASSQYCYDMHDWLSLRRPYHVQLLSSVIMYGVLVRWMGVHDINNHTSSNVNHRGKFMPVPKVSVGCPLGPCINKKLFLDP